MLSTRTSGERIDAVDKKLGDRIDAVNKNLGERIDAVDTKLGAKIDANTQAITSLRGMLKTLAWVLGSAGSLAAIVNIGKAFKWF